MKEQQQSPQALDELGVYRKEEMSTLVTEEQMQYYRSLELSKQLHICHLIMSGVSYDEARRTADQYFE